MNGFDFVYRQDGSEDIDTTIFCFNQDELIAYLRKAWELVKDEVGDPRRLAAGRWYTVERHSIRGLPDAPTCTSLDILEEYISIDEFDEWKNDDDVDCFECEDAAALAKLLEINRYIFEGSFRVNRPEPMPIKHFLIRSWGIAPEYDCEDRTETEGEGYEWEELGIEEWEI